MAGENIPWRHNLEAALEETRESGKLCFVDLFNPG